MVLAQLPPRPYINNFSYKDYNGEPQCWSLIQGEKGKIYIGTWDIMSFDGQYWKRIEVGDSHWVLSMAKNKDGKIFVGGLGEMGYLETAPTGETIFYSLKDSLKPENRNFTYLWRTFSYKGGVLFNDFSGLYHWTGEEFKVYRPETFFNLAFKVNERIFVSQKDIGLMELRDDRVVLVPGGDALKRKRIQGMLPFKNGNTNNGELLLFSATDGLLVLNTSNGNLRKLDKDVNKLLVNHQVNGVTRLTQGKIAVNTKEGGVLVLDSLLEVETVYNTANGLLDNYINSSYVDREDNLWLAHEKGVSIIAYNSRVDIYNESVGIRGRVHGVAPAGDRLYLLNSVGVDVSTDRQKNYLRNITEDIPLFEPVSGINGDSWDAVNYNDGLIITSTRGIYNLRNNEATLIYDRDALTLAKSPVSHDVVFVGGIGGLVAIIKGSNNQWVQLHEYTDVTAEVRDIVVDAKNDNLILWVSTYTKGVIRIFLNNDYSLDHLQWFNTSHGLPPGYSRVNKLGDRIVVVTMDGIYYYDEEDAAFRKDNRFPEEYTDGTTYSINRIEEDSLGAWAILLKNGRSMVSRLKLTENDVYEFDIDPYRNIKIGAIDDIHIGKDYTWFAGVEGVVRYSESTARRDQKSFHALISSITTANDSIIYQGNGQEGNFVDVKIDYNFNTLTFKYAAPYFNYSEDVEYSYQLEGFDETWKDWTKLSQVTYTNLSEGRYAFRVKAKNIYDTESSEDSFEFIVLPPWHRSVYAYIIYVVALILMIYLIVRLSMLRLRHAKQRLERIVQDRTAQLEEEKKVVEKQNSMIVKKNKDITDSINYARRIQESILPTENRILERFPESFVLYRAKDIVSGDFYWISTKNGKTFIAVADCTGHGVPGAFMSMIGNTLLGEIVNQQGIEKPSEILHQLHTGVRKALNRKLGEEESQDGMDIALCMVDREKKEVVFSGANRPLFIYQDNVIKEIDGDIYSIGLTDVVTVEPVYTDHMLYVNDNTRIYLSTDGFADQFGGERNKKFTAKRLKQLLESIAEYDMELQKKELIYAFEKWRNEQKQLDDILIIGLKP